MDVNPFLESSFLGTVAWWTRGACFGYESQVQHINHATRCNRWAGSAQARLSRTRHGSRALATWEPGQVAPWAVTYQHCTPGEPQGRASPRPGPTSPAALRAHTALVTCYTLPVLSARGWAPTHPAGHQRSEPRFKGRTTETQRRPHSSAEGQSQSFTGSRGRLFPQQLCFTAAQTALGSRASPRACPRQGALARST